MDLGTWLMLTAILFLLSMCLSELKAIRKVIAPQPIIEPQERADD